MAALAQSPPRLDVYSDAFAPGSTGAPASAQRGTSMLVDVAALEQLEADTAALEARMAAHVADATAHYPHTGYHNHDHGGSTSSYTADAAPVGHGELGELLAALADLLLARAQAQAPLELYRDDLSGPGATAPASANPDMRTTLDNDIPLIEQARALIAQLNQRLTAHIAARPGHAHPDPHSH